MRPNNEPGFQDGLNQLPKSKLRIKDPTLNKVTKKIPFVIIILGIMVNTRGLGQGIGPLLLRK